ncbi:hypothetical protein [Salmonella enterica]|uniref:hypothetical protein n=1 Tax=Salmonella enterica TaxID=28901 RepID=UPI00117A8B2D|nr:hypothetical protein [Salmonella enterica]
MLTAVPAVHGFYRGKITGQHMPVMLRIIRLNDGFHLYTTEPANQRVMTGVIFINKFPVG